MSGSTQIARSEQARAQDTLRWGGMYMLTWGLSPSAANFATALATAQATYGAQLVDAHWRWPLSWRVALVLVPQPSPPDGDIFVQFAITFGSGDAQQTILRTVAVLAGQVDSTIDNLLALPACDIMVRVVKVTSSDNKPVEGQAGVEIGAYVAPETEPHATLAVLDCICRLEEKFGPNHGAIDQRQGDWMPPGFVPEPLGYRR